MTSHVTAPASVTLCSFLNTVLRIKGYRCGNRACRWVLPKPVIYVAAGILDRHYRGTSWVEVRAPSLGKLACVEIYHYPIRQSSRESGWLDCSKARLINRIATIRALVHAHTKKFLGHEKRGCQESRPARAGSPANRLRVSIMPGFRHCTLGSRVFAGVWIILDPFAYMAL